MAHDRETRIRPLTPMSMSFLRTPLTSCMSDKLLCRCVRANRASPTRIAIYHAVGSASLLLVFLVMTLVIAWRMTTPAFSISFFDRPVVAQTFRAGCVWPPPTLLLMSVVLRRVIITPLASACICLVSHNIQTHHQNGGRGGSTNLINTILQYPVLFLKRHPP